MLNDLRFAFRQLLKNPGFTAVAVLTLALGIGANTAIFSVVNGVLLKPLPYEQPGQLVHLWEDPSGTGQSQNHVAGGVFADWKEYCTSFQALALIQDGADMNLTGDGRPERLSGHRVSATFLDILRLRPVLGRGFLPDEDQPGKDKVVVLSHGFWRRRFGGDTNLIGRVIRLNGESFTVIGVLPSKVRLQHEFDFLVPLAFGAEEWHRSREHHSFRVIARLKPEVTLEAARAEMHALSSRLKPLYPASKKDWGFSVVLMHEQLTGGVRRTLLVLLGAVGFVLLIGCVNVANLLLARTVAREKEIAIRAALGAGRWRVIRQLLTESLVLALFGGALGLALAFWGVDALTRFTAANLPRIDDVAVDWRVFGFASLLSVLTGLIFGSAAALQASKPDLTHPLKEGGRSSVSGSRNRLRSGLIVAEVTMSLVLLAGAGLLLKSFLRLQAVPPGFDPKNVLTMYLTLDANRYPNSERHAQFLHQLFERLETLPGVEAACGATMLPMIGWSFGGSVRVEGRVNQPELGYNAHWDFVSGNYFRVLGIPLVKGRILTERDNSTKAPRAAVFSEALARKVFPDEDPIGRRIRFWDETWEVVGVVGSVRHHGLDEPASERIYLPQVFNSWVGCLAVRTTGPPMSFADPVRQTILALDADQPVSNLRPLELLVANSVAQRRLTLLLIGTFATVALLLAAIGLYGVMAYLVTQRTHEIGVRMALGAQSTDVLKLVLKHGMGLALLGLALGLIGAFGLTRVIATQLFEVGATDPTTLAGVSALLAAVAFAACWLPARRAAKVDPMEALRHE